MVFQQNVRLTIDNELLPQSDITGLELDDQLDKIIAHLHKAMQKGFKDAELKLKY